MRHLLIILVSVMPCSVIASQWDIAKEPVPHSIEALVRVAVVENDLGHSLKIYVDDAGMVRGMFTINGGFDVLATAVCPTYRVDQRPPQIVRIGESACQVEAKRVTFSFGQRQDGAIHSTQLHRLMNGTTVVFSYQLKSVGYRESAFSLSRSNYAVRGAIGNVVKE